MRPLALIANGGMLLATPMGGGHYFVDVFAGVAVAVLAIAAAKRLGARMTRGALAPVAATPMPETAAALSFFPSSGGVGNENASRSAHVTTEFSNSQASSPVFLAAPGTP